MAHLNFRNIVNYGITYYLIRYIYFQTRSIQIMLHRQPMSSFLLNTLGKNLATTSIFFTSFHRDFRNKVNYRITYYLIRDISVSNLINTNNASPVAEICIYLFILFF